MTRPIVEKTYYDDSSGISLMLISGRIVLGVMGGDAGHVLEAERLRELAMAFAEAAKDAKEVIP